MGAPLHPAESAGVAALYRVGVRPCRGLSDRDRNAIGRFCCGAVGFVVVGQ